MMVTVFVVGDVRLYREGLTVRLGRLQGVTADEACDDAGLLARLERAPPEVLLLDMSSPRGLQCARLVAKVAPNTRVIALGVPETEEDIIRCAEAGIAGYVPRDGSMDDLVRVVEGALRGESIISRQIAGSLLRRVGSLAAEVRRGSAQDELTRREREIAAHLERGESNKQIARSLGIRLATVKNHVHAILKKLNIERRAKVGEALRLSRTANRDRRGLAPPLVGPGGHPALAGNGRRGRGDTAAHLRSRNGPARSRRTG